MAALAFAGPASAALPADTQGRDFWLAVMSNPATGGMEVPDPPTVLISGAIATSGTVSVPGLSFSQGFSVTPGTATEVRLPVGAELDAADGVQQRAVHVTAEADIRVALYNDGSSSADSHVALPTDVLGRDHRILSAGTLVDGTSSELAVVAAEDDTTVTITPSVTVGARTAGTPYAVQLDRGEAYELTGGSTTTDLSSTRVTSDRPVAVLGGHQCAYVGPGYCDFLVEQMPPLETWGRRFLLLPFASRTGGDVVRIMAARDSTAISVDGAPSLTLNEGAFLERGLTGPMSIVADGPLLVAQYARGSAEEPDQQGDPFMAIVTPAEQWGNEELTFVVPATGYAENFVNLVVPSSAASSLSVDGAPVAAESVTVIGSSGYSAVAVAVSPGVHRASASAPFAGTVYGWRTHESYGHPIGHLVAPVARVAGVRLAPESATRFLGNQECLAATAVDAAGDPVPSVRIDFRVTGANAAAGAASANAAGVATFCVTGAQRGVSAIAAAVGDVSTTGTRRWVKLASIGLEPAAADRRVGTPDCTALMVTDDQGDPVPGVDVSVAVTGVNPGGGVVSTAGDGRSTYCYTGTVPGRDVLTATATGVAGTAQRTWTAAALPTPDEPTLLRCTGRDVVLTTVTPSGRRVRVGGIARTKYAGMPVTIRLGKRLAARATVRPDGTFEAVAKRPSGGARFTATVGGSTSLALKTTRGLLLGAQKLLGARVRISGALTGAKRGRRRLSLRREEGCNPGQVVQIATVKTDAKGRFSVTVPRPTARNAIAVYRLRTTGGGTTYTLPILVRATP